MATSSKSTNTNLYLTTLTAYQTASLFGYSVGFIGGLLVLPSFLTHFHLSSLPPSALAAAQARIVTLWLVGALFGVPIGIPICSTYGRKAGLRMSALLYVLGASLQVSGYRGVQGFEVGRAVNGLGVGVGTLVSPLFIAEISPPSKRGMLMSGYQTILQLSALAGFWGAYLSNSFFSDDNNLQWQIPVAIQLIPGIILLLGTLTIPETPRFLASKERWIECEEALTWLRNSSMNSSAMREEMEELQTVSNARFAAGEKVNFWKEALRKDVRARLGVGIGLMIAQNMVGLNALNYYAPTIFITSGFPSISASLFLTGIFGVVKLLSAIAFMFVFVKIKGNRFWLLFGSILCGVSMIILAYFVHNLNLPQSGETKPTASGIISILAVYVFAFSFSVSLGPISWNVCSEIFPTHINAKCCAITTCTQWLFQIIIAYITPRLLASIGWKTYIIYASFCLLTAIWIYFLVPETRGVRLGKEMDGVFGVTCAEDEELDIGEATALLGDVAVGRRASLGSYT